jgi:hypothetical protein
MGEVPYSIAKKFLNRYATYVGMRREKDTWLAYNDAVISLSPSQMVDYFHLEAIATEQLEIGILEFDYFLGQNQVN